MATYINVRSIVVNESEGFADIVITLSVATAGGVTISYFVSYDTAQFNDFTSNSGTLTFGAAETSKTLRVALTNDTATSLPAGVLTLYDPASPAMFAGDARLGGLPAGESRLLSFAEDLRTAVAWKQEEAMSLAAVSASQGVLRVDERLRWTTQMVLTGPAGEARDLLVEVAKWPGSALVADPALMPSEETATAWRFAVALKPGEARTLVVRQDRIQRQVAGLLDGEQAVLRVMGMQGLDPTARAALQRLVDLRVALAQRNAEGERLTAQAEQIEADQERIRRNLGAVPSNDALHGRLLRQLEAQETRMEAVRRSQEGGRATVEQAQRALEAAIARFTL